MAIIRYLSPLSGGIFSSSFAAGALVGNALTTGPTSHIDGHSEFFIMFITGTLAEATGVTFDGTPMEFINVNPRLQIAWIAATSGFLGSGQFVTQFAGSTAGTIIWGQYAGIDRDTPIVGLNTQTWTDPSGVEPLTLATTLGVRQNSDSWISCHAFTYGATSGRIEPQTPEYTISTGITTTSRRWAMKDIQIPGSSASEIFDDFTTAVSPAVNPTRTAVIFELSVPVDPVISGSDPIQLMVGV